jgi:hypothetical protein
VHNTATPLYPWEYERAATLSVVCADWIDSRVNDTFVYWTHGRLVRYDEAEHDAQVGEDIYVPTGRVFWDKLL